MRRTVLCLSRRELAHWRSSPSDSSFRPPAVVEQAPPGQQARTARQGQPWQTGKNEDATGLPQCSKDISSYRLLAMKTAIGLAARYFAAAIGPDVVRALPGPTGLFSIITHTAAFPLRSQIVIKTARHQPVRNPPEVDSHRAPLGEWPSDPPKPSPKAADVGQSPAILTL